MGSAMTIRRRVNIGQSIVFVGGNLFVGKLIN